MTTQFVKRVPTVDPSLFYRVQITPIRQRHLLWWDTHVQPQINRLPHRADQGWRWKRHLTTARLAGFRHHVRDFALTTRHPSRNTEIVLGFVIVATQYPFLPNPKISSAFLWFCSTIPSSVLTQHLPPPLPKRLGLITVDMAVTLAFRNLWSGRMGTHAHPQGGRPLQQFYEQTCQMTRLPHHASLPSWGRRLFMVNDGRYYYLDEDAALTFSHRLTHLRTME